MAEGDLSRSDQIASVVSMLVALAGFPLTVVAAAIAIHGIHHRPLAGSEHRSEFAAELASEMSAKWTVEELNRAIQDPAPIDVKWENAREDVLDHWTNITDDRHARDLGPLDLSGSFDRIYEVYRRVPSRRLVILGKSGSGKTTLAVRLLLQSIEHRKARGRGPVPILLPLAEWRPNRQTLEDWTIDRLCAECPQLDDRYRNTAHQFKLMLREGDVMPIFDGLDELPSEERRLVIGQINRAIVGPLVLTSRMPEYQATVLATDMLTSAAGVTLLDVSYDELNRFLPRTTHKSATTKWDSLLERMRNPDPASPEKALSEVLTTPFMISLARFAFSDTRADPEDLVEAVRRSDHYNGWQGELARQLYSTFLAAAYNDGRRLEIAKRRLTFFARFLVRTNRRYFDAREIRWSLPWLFGLLWLVGIPIGVGAGLLVGASPQPVSGFFSGFAMSPLILLISGTWASIEQWALRMPGYDRGFLGVAGFHFLLMTLPFGITIGLTSNWKHAGSITIGVGLGLLAWISCYFLWESRRKPRAPTSSLWQYLTTLAPLVAILASSVVGIGILIGSLFGAFLLRHAEFFVRASNDQSGVPGGVTVGLVLGVLAGLLPVVTLVLITGLANVWFFLRRRLPLNISHFLVDARRRGVVRRAGARYEFRHAGLRDYLAGRDGEAPRRASAQR